MTGFFKLNCLLVGCVILLGFINAPDTRQMLNWSNHLLAHIYNPSGDVKLKKWELNISDNYFLRLRKTYQNGKQKYFSCQLSAFNDIDYVGNSANGLIKISTKACDIIVQTYNDRKGNVDSMSTTLTIPVKNIEAEQIDSLRNALLYFKTGPPATWR